MSSAASRRPAAASSAPTAASCSRAGAERLHEVGTSAARAARRTSGSVAARPATSAPRRRLALRRRGHQPAPPVASASRRRLAELPVRCERGIVQPQIVGQDPEDVGRVIRPAGHAEVDLGHGAVAVAAQEVARSPDCTTAGSVRRPVTRGPARASGCPANTAADAGSARMAVASGHRSRSISVVTLWGRPRRTACSSPGFTRSPERAFRPRPAGRSPGRGGGRTVGTTGKPRWPRIRSAWSSRCAARGAGRHRECRAELLAHAFGPAQCRLGPEQGRGPGIPAPGPAPPPEHVPEQPPRRPDGDGEPGIGEQACAARRPNAASMTSNTRGTMARPVALRSTGVRSKKMRWPASAYGRGPVTGLRHGEMRRPRQREERDQPDAGQAHRGERPGQPLGQAEAQVDARRPPGRSAVSSGSG